MLQSLMLFIVLVILSYQADSNQVVETVKSTKAFLKRYYHSRDQENNWPVISPSPETATRTSPSGTS